MKLITLEKRQRFSHSCLWQFQSQYYTDQGIDAWLTDVPFFVTCNPVVAKTYATLINAFVQDLPPSTPLTILELGAGSGKLTHLMLHALTQQLPESTPWRYLMSDFAEKNVTFWQTQPQLAEWMAQGRLHTRQIDCLNPRGMTHLPILEGPVVVIANYLFDTLPHDAFFVDAGTLHTSLLTLKAPKDHVKGKQLLQATHLDMQFTHKATSPQVYANPHWNQALQDYQNQISGHILAPIGALTCLSTLTQAAPHGLLVLTSDKGYTQLNEIEQLGAPRVAEHGSISAMVNYDMIARVVNTQGGQSWLQSPRSGIRTCAFAMGDLPLLNHLQQSYLQTVEAFGPADYFQLHTLLKTQKPELRQLLGYLALSGWDPYVLHQQHATLRELCLRCTKLEKQYLLHGLNQIKAHLFELPTQDDEWGEMGMLYHNLGQYTEAIHCYQESVKRLGKQVHIWYNMASCYSYIDQRPQALASVEQALALDPQDAGSLSLKEQLLG